MHQIKLPHCEVLFVEAPEAIDGIEVKPEIIGNKLTAYRTIIPLPPGQWSLVGITPLSEEQAGEVVELAKGCKMTYKRYGEEPWRLCSSTIKSFASLLTSQGIDITKRWVVLKCNN